MWPLFAGLISAIRQYESRSSADEMAEQGLETSDKIVILMEPKAMNINLTP